MATSAAGRDLRVRGSKELLRRHGEGNAMAGNHNPARGGVMVRRRVVANTAKATPRQSSDALERRAENKRMKVHFLF